jgi:hypothetical protein
MSFGCLKSAAVLFALFSTAAAGQEPHWNAVWQSGIAQIMQLSLGGTFNEGPAQQNRLVVSRSGVLTDRDNLQMYAWSTTDLRNAATDTDVGIRYRRPVREIAGGRLIAGGGVEHWRFPSVLGGTRDIVADSYLGWTGGESFPFTISANGKTLVRSDLERGTFVCVQATGSHRLAQFGSTRLILQQGPVYVYSWNLYGRNGHRVLRYGVTLQANSDSWMFEAGFRPQAGLQPGIPDNKYWLVSVGRRFGF